MERSERSMNLLKSFSESAEKNRFADVSRRGNQKYEKLIATWMTEIDQDFIVNIVNFVSGMVMLPR